MQKIIKANIIMASASRKSSSTAKNHIIAPKNAIKEIDNISLSQKE
jgi:hypothetical protein